MPKFSFPGGLIIGCDAGTLNVLKIKGTHNAMKTGIIAAETFYNDSVHNINSLELREFNTKFKNSFIYKELYKSRNVRPGFNKGLLLGTLNAFVDQKIFRGNAPLTLKHQIKDHNSLKNIKNSKKIFYPSKKDNIFSFDRLTNVSFSGTNHKEDQPNHLKIIKAAIVRIILEPLKINL